MKGKKLKKKGYSASKPYEVRDYFAKRLVDSGLTMDKFNKLMGVCKNETKRFR